MQGHRGRLPFGRTTSRYSAEERDRSQDVTDDVNPHTDLAKSANPRLRMVC